MAKSNLQNQPKVDSKQKEAKEKIAELLDGGLTSATEAAELMKLLGLKPQKTFKGQPVVMLYATTDGQFFYAEAAARQHATKTVKNKTIFEVKPD